MGKEIKISLAVITMLLGVMGYVVYRQFAGPGDDQPAADLANASEQELGTLSTVESDGTRTAAESSPPTVVTATTGSPGSMATSPTRTANLWNQAASITSAADQPAAEPGSEEFSYMPQAPAVSAASAGRYATQYGGGSPPAAAGGSWSNDVSNSRASQYGTYPTYASQPSTPPYTPGTSTSVGTGGPGYQSSASSAGNQRYASPTERTGSQAYQYSNSQTVSPQGTSGTSAETVQAPSAGYSGSSDSYGSSGEQNPLRDQYGSSVSGTSVQPSSSYGADAGSQYATSSGFGPHTPSTTTPATASPSTYSGNPASTYATDSTSGYRTDSTSTYPSSSNSTYGSGSDVSAAGQSPLDYSASSSQSSFGGNDVIQTQPQTGRYLIQPNDSYWLISQRLYGTGSYFRALAEHNRSTHPDTHQLRVGDEIETPGASTLESLYPALCPKPSHREAIKQRASVAATAQPASGEKVYVVQAGDTLFDIARYELGKASRWVEIYQLNRRRLGTNFDYLTPGLKLVMPQDQPAQTVTQGPGTTYQR